MDLISIVVPVYNTEKYLRRCIDSITNQTYMNLEIILVDDGSTDSSGQICNEYSKTDSRIKVIHKENAGLGYARNTGLSVATGEYVTFIDSDDYVKLNMIENLHRDLKAYGVDTCIGGFTRVKNNTETKVENPLMGKCFFNTQVKQQVLPRLFGKNEKGEYLEMSVWKVLFSLEIIKKNGLKFPSEREFISEDIIFDVDYYNLSSGVYMSEDAGYCYVDNSDSLTTRYRQDRFSMNEKLFVELDRRTKKIGINEITRQQRSSTIASMARYCIRQEVLFSNINGFRNAITNISTICDSNVLKDVFTYYKEADLNKGQVLIDWCIKTRKVKTLFAITKFRILIGM